MANYQFGSGKMVMTPAGATPIELGLMQDVTVDFKINTKKLYGPYHFPVAIADAESEINVTAKSATFYANAFNIAIGSTSTTGGNSVVFDEVGTVASGAYTVAKQTAFVANTSVVWFTPSGGGLSRQLKPVASTPVSGVSYVEAGGSMTFSSSDNGGTVRVTYQYTLTSGGQTLTLSNALMNTQLGVKINLYEQSMNRSTNTPSTFILTLNNCILPGLKLDFKNSDWTIPDYTIEVAADQSNNLGLAYFWNYDQNGAS